MAMLMTGLMRMLLALAPTAVRSGPSMVSRTALKASSARQAETKWKAESRGVTARNMHQRAAGAPEPHRAFWFVPPVRTSARASLPGRRTPPVLPSCPPSVRSDCTFNSTPAIASAIPPTDHRRDRPTGH